MVHIGQQMAAQLRLAHLQFTELLSALKAAIYGSPQAPSSTLRMRVRATFFDVGRPANYILLNKLPLYSGEDFVTTQNLGEGAFAPLHVWNREKFIQDIVASGYELRDEWPVLERSLYLPGHHRRRSVPSFSGLYFVRQMA